MGLWDYLTRRREISAEMWEKRSALPREDSCLLPDARGWIGLGVWVMSAALLLMMFLDKAFREDEFVQTIATLVIGTGFVGGAVAWAYSSTKSGNELAQSSSRIAEQAATAAVNRLPGGDGAPGSKENPLAVEGAGPDAQPITTIEGESR